MERFDELTGPETTSITESWEGLAERGDVELEQMIGREVEDLCEEGVLCRVEVEVLGLFEGVRALGMFSDGKVLLMDLGSVKVESQELGQRVE